MGPKILLGVTGGPLDSHTSVCSDVFLPVPTNTHKSSVCVGSVAAIKVPALCQLLLELGDVKVISTLPAQTFMALGADLPSAEGLQFLNVSSSMVVWP